MKLENSETVIVGVSEFVVVDGVYRSSGLSELPSFDDRVNADSIRYLIEECKPASVEDGQKLEMAIGHHFRGMAFRVYLSDKPYAYRRFPSQDGEVYVQDVEIEHVAARDEDGEMVAATSCNGVVYQVDNIELEDADIVFHCSRLGRDFADDFAVFRYGKISCSSGDKLSCEGITKEFDSPC